LTAVNNQNRAYESGAHNWATALQTYRHSVDLYRHVLEMRSRRFAALTPVRTATAEAAPAERSTDGNNDDKLTPREREVAGLIARGYTNRQIADTLIVTQGTVANHVAHILTKLGLANRTQVAAYMSGSGSGPALDTWTEPPMRKVS
jgi:DNA-binding NarL/FixJ family response regulator